MYVVEVSYQPNLGPEQVPVVKIRRATTLEIAQQQAEYHNPPLDYSFYTRSREEAERIARHWTEA